MVLVLLRNLEATSSNCGNIQSGFLYRLLLEKANRHHRETCGYGNNQKDMDNPQPSPNPLIKVWMQFRDSMSVGRGNTA